MTFAMLTPARPGGASVEVQGQENGTGAIFGAFTLLPFGAPGAAIEYVEDHSAGGDACGAGAWRGGYHG